MVLESLPPGTRYCFWYHYSTRQTQFGREVEKAMDATGKALVVAGVAAGAAGLIVLDVLDDDDCDYGYSPAPQPPRSEPEVPDSAWRTPAKAQRRSVTDGN